MKNLLFFGELPPEYYHGISISNDRILKKLSNRFNVFTILDESCGKGKCKKILLFMIYFFKILFYSKSYSDIFYTNLPSSRFGIIKLFFIVFFLRLFNQKISIVLHLHRGDLLNTLCNDFNKLAFLGLYSKVDNIIVLSNKTKKELLDNVIDYRENKLVVLYNTITPEVNKEDVLLDRNDILCLCNYIRTKRIDSLVKISNKIKLDINFYGATYDTSYMKFLHNLNLNGYCKFNPIISGQKKFQLLKKSKFLVLPSLNEGMPLTILESLSQGTPVICFNIGDISEYLGSDYPGIVKELDDISLEKKIKSLNSLSEKDYLKLRNLSFNLFWDNYSDKVVNKKLDLIF